MTVPESVNVLGVRVADTSLEEVARLVLTTAEEGRGLTVSPMALHGVTVAHRDPAFRARLSELDVITPDGAPVAAAARLFYPGRRVERIPGPDLSVRVLELAAERTVPVFFFGSTPETLDGLRTRLAERFSALPVVGTRPSRFRRADPGEEAEVREEIRASGARILFVGLGCPREEVWLQENAGELPMPILAVGGAFDVMAGRVPRAPHWLRRIGFEWAHRVVMEPRRLLPRYLTTGPRFVAGCVGQALSGAPDPRPLDPTTLRSERYG